jgi:hypothetical protein
VTPQGRPEAPSVTLPVNPPTGNTLTVVETDKLNPTVRDGVAVLRVKPGATVTLTRIGAVTVRGPLTPVTVRLAEDTAAEASAVSVSVAVLPAGADTGVNAADMPAGSPETARVTLPWNPPLLPILMLVLADAPAATVKAGGAVTVKPGAAVTARLTGVVPVALPLVPLTVTFATDTAAEAEAVSVRVELPPAAADAGTNAAVTPAGSPEAANVTLPAKPLVPMILTVVAVEDPAATVKDEAVAARVKPGAAVTVRISGVVLDRLPMPPVIVRLAEVAAAEAAALSVSV